MKGQITTGILITIGTLIASSVAVIFGIKLNAVEQVSAVSERVAKLETAMPTIRDDTQEIKASIKEINKNVLEITKAIRTQ